MWVYQDHFRGLFQASVLEIDAVKNFRFDILIDEEIKNDCKSYEPNSGMLFYLKT